MTRAAFAARIYVVLAAVAVAFQLALVAGAPWGELTMGGANPGVLPGRMRAVAAVSAVALALFGCIVAARADIALQRWAKASRILIWVVVAYSLIGVVVNAITPSARERMLWLPVAIVMAACSIIVARFSVANGSP